MCRSFQLCSGVHPFLQVLVEPNNSLAESLLLGPLLGLVVQVTADGEAVRNAAEQVDLPRLASLDESLLGLVAELSGEDAVGLCFVLENSRF